MIRCAQGHFYDHARHAACPWCSGPAAPEAAPHTVPLAAPQPAAAAPVTQRLAPNESGVDPVVGWLVCLEGVGRGCDYRIRTGKNFIGRSPAMDICVAGDASISRDKHAAVVFEPKRQEFWILPGESNGLVYLNGDLVNGAALLARGDTIELGRSRFVLVPFVNDTFRWD